MTPSKFDMLCPSIEGTGFTDMAHLLVYLYRKSAGLYGIIRVDTVSANAEDVEEFFEPYREILRQFGIISTDDAAPSIFNYVVMLRCTKEDDELLAEMKQMGISTSYMVIDKKDFDKSDYELCRDKFHKTFGGYPIVLQDVTKYQIVSGRPVTEEDYEDYIRKCGMIPVNVSSTVNRITEMVQSQSALTLVVQIYDILEDIYQKTKEPDKLGFFIPSSEAELRSVGELVSALMFVKYGKPLESLFMRSPLLQIQNLTPRGPYALLESKVKFHMDYPVWALYVGEYLQYVCLFDDKLKMQKRLPLYFFKMSKLEDGTAKLGYSEFPLDWIEIIPIIEYFNLDSKDDAVYKEGHARFLKCALVVDTGLHGNIPLTVLNKCIVFKKTNSNDGEIYFGFCNSDIDVTVQARIVPLTDTPIEPTVTTFTTKDFAKILPISYISDIHKQLADKDSNLCRIMEQLRLRNKGRYADRKLSFYEKTGLDMRAYLYNVNETHRSDTFRQALEIGTVDRTSVCAFSNLQREYSKQLIPNLSKVFTVKRLRELNFISAFGGFVPGLSTPLQLSETSLGGDGLYGYADIDKQSR